VASTKLAQQEKVARRDRVAIVGFAGTTRHLAPYEDKTVEIWCLNEAHRQPWMKRITRWFQVHQRWDFTKQNNVSYKEHWEWLQKEHPFPIYMLEKYPDVPSSVAYPLEEIAAKLLPNVRRGKNWKESVRNDYFTSSFAWMCALALFEGFKTIEVYGFEMATDTEYRYQKGSTEFWLGVAAGMRVNVLVTQDCQLLQGKIYGRDVSRMINRQRLEFLQARFKGDLKVAEMELARVNGRRGENDRLYQTSKLTEQKKVYAVRGRELLEQEINALGQVAERRGRVGMLTDLVKIVDNMHLGKDPGDGFFGPEGDLDPKAEDDRQREAEASAEQAEKPAEPDAGPSEG
jgi:hypothetical protein